MSAIRSMDETTPVYWYIAGRCWKGCSEHLISFGSYAGCPRCERHTAAVVGYVLSNADLRPLDSLELLEMNRVKWERHIQERYPNIWAVHREWGNEATASPGLDFIPLGGAPKEPEYRLLTLQQPAHIDDIRVHRRSLREVFWQFVHGVAHLLLLTNARWSHRLHDWSANKAWPDDE